MDTVRVLTERVAQYERHLSELKRERTGVRHLRDIRSLSEVMKLMFYEIGEHIGKTKDDKTAMELVTLCRRCSALCSALVGLACDTTTKLDAMERTTK